VALNLKVNLSDSVLRVSASPPFLWARTFFYRDPNPISAGLAFCLLLGEHMSVPRDHMRGQLKHFLKFIYNYIYIYTHTHSIFHDLE
jgi:hypothetical protein